ncbi:MAG: hypothetical protein IMY80_08235 [Chloroflexi bacterium]|nr:hypothetical protein [Chloroflexota bacterium]
MDRSLFYFLAIMEIALVETLRRGVYDRYSIGKPRGSLCIRQLAGVSLLVHPDYVQRPFALL